MTASQYARLERRLAELKRELEHKIRDRSPKPLDEKFVERAGMAFDQADEAVELVEESFNQTLQERYVSELRQVEAACDRCATGEIDRCSDCDGVIQFKRLLAYPLAVRCTACQARHEKTFGGAQSPKL